MFGFAGISTAVGLAGIRRKIVHQTLVIAMVVAGLAGVAVISPPGSNTFAATKASACVSTFKIVWSQVGVRDGRYSGAYIFTYRYQGQYVYGPIGGTYGGFTEINVADPITGGARSGYIPDGSRVYVGCR